MLKLNTTLNKDVQVLFKVVCRTKYTPYAVSCGNGSSWENACG